MGYAALKRRSSTSLDAAWWRTGPQNIDINIDVDIDCQTSPSPSPSTSTSTSKATDKRVRSTWIKGGAGF